METEDAGNNIIYTPSNHDLIITDVTAGLVAVHHCAGNGRIILQIQRWSQLSIQRLPYTALSNGEWRHTPLTKICGIL